MSRHGILLLAVLGAFLCADLSVGSAWAQEALSATSPAQAGESVGTGSSEAQAEANAAIAQRLLQGPQKSRCGVPGPDGSIVVCGGREANDKERLPLRDDLESAHSTKDGLPRAPNISGLPDCSRGCIGFGGVPAPMYYFDITKLPEAPPDSDADKIARGEIRAP